MLNPLAPYAAKSFYPPYLIRRFAFAGIYGGAVPDFPQVMRRCFNCAKNAIAVKERYTASKPQSLLATVWGIADQVRNDTGRDVTVHTLTVSDADEIG
jgi:hypothetical protein